MTGGTVAALILPELNAMILAFCRVSAFLMVLPGFSSIRIPVRIRLVAALGVSVAMLPFVAAGVEPDSMAVGAELLVGAVLGLMVRMYFLAFGFAATMLASFTGIAAMPGAPLESEEANSPVTAMLTLTATAMVFAAGLHAEFIAALALSYDVLPTGQWLAPDRMLARLTEVLAEGFLVALRLAMPFLIFSVVVNLAVGLANKAAPQVPVYFVSLPFVAAGGLIVLWQLGPDMIGLFAVSARDILAGQGL
ncbi:MAG: flagellar biosynthetic protein FliR [Rhizobiaceae bacterium]|jgi:flagellar biosynthetic protein FliR|nr:flagellar biosynthetic protein FliR [Rhizobiaceae bacterium]